MKNGNRRRGRPPKFVLDPNDRPIVGLSYNKANHSYYATYSNPRMWFGSDFAEALFKFRQWQCQQEQKEPVVEIDLPFPPEPQKTGIVEWPEISNEPPIIADTYAGETAAIPAHLFYETARNIILANPIEAAKKLGIPELARLTDLPPLEPPLYLDAVLQFYLKPRESKKEECRKATSAWKEFCKMVPVKTVREITSDMIHDYHDAIYKEYDEKGWAPTWIKGRFSRVKTIFNYSRDKGRTNKDELVKVTELCRCLTAPTAVGEDARPIEREHVHQLLDHCSV
ncbi:MAG: hypothetical protein ACYSSP_07225, partial [Planctomycetota bacterium]